VADTVLAFDRLAAPGATPVRSVVFLHGIFGRGSNWRSFAKRLVAEAPEWGAVLVDLRAHGESQGFAGPHTVARAAADLDAVAAAVEKDAPVRAVVGHSFGGKVALAWIGSRTGIEQGWIVDSTPGPRADRRGSEATVAALETLRALASRGGFARREDVVQAIVARGEPSLVAQFLATNFDRDASGKYVLAIELDAIAALLEDYFAIDLWKVIESPPAGTHLTLVAGGRSAVLSPKDLDRTRRAEATVHVVPQAGHWVHVDAPDALHELIATALRV
jgi:esterase